MFIKLVMIVQEGRIYIAIESSHGYFEKKIKGEKWAKYLVRERRLSLLYSIFLKLNLSKEKTRMMKDQGLANIRHGELRLRNTLFLGQ